MLQHAIPVKTDAGRIEIEQRKLKLGPRQRMILISANGERDVTSIKAQYAAMGDVEAILSELREAGLIEFAHDHEDAGDAAAHDTAQVAPAAQAVAAPVHAPATVSAAAQAGLQAARDYMKQMISAKVGLRAFLFNQKIDKAADANALLELLPECRRMLRKHMDAGRVADFSDHAEQLIRHG